jgi:hypothetical protein
VERSAETTRDDPDGEYLKRNRWFESGSLQRGVACEPDFRGTGGEVVQGLCIFWNGRAREPSQAGVFIRNE